MTEILDDFDDLQMRFGDFRRNFGQFHRHNDGWNLLLAGRKRWFLYPPTFTHDTVDLTLSTTE